MVAIESARAGHVGLALLEPTDGEPLRRLFYRLSPETVYWRRVHGENNSLTNRGALGELPRTLKASLDRRRAAAGQQ